jgi:aryl-alcohol dehydrogenase-like predicted oxidoreductase
VVCAHAHLHVLCVRLQAQALVNHSHPCTCTRTAHAARTSVGGWPRFQALLRAAAAVAAARGVAVEAVAVRWALDRGVTPVVELPLLEAAGGGGGGPALPFLEPRLLGAESFLTAADAAALAEGAW